VLRCHRAFRIFDPESTYQGYGRILMVEVMVGVRRPLSSSITNPIHRCHCLRFWVSCIDSGSFQRTWYSPLALLEFKSCFPISLLACNSRHASFDIPQPRRWCAHMSRFSVLFEVKKASLSCGRTVGFEFGKAQPPYLLASMFLFFAKRRAQPS